MKDYKELYLKSFFFWQEAYDKLYQQNKQLIEKIDELENKIKELEKIIMINY